jgi:hypothetical protein
LFISDYHNFSTHNLLTWFPFEFSVVLENFVNWTVLLAFPCSFILCIDAINVRKKSLRKKLKLEMISQTTSHTMYIIPLPLTNLTNLYLQFPKSISYTCTSNYSLTEFDILYFMVEHTWKTYRKLLFFSFVLQLSSTIKT